MSDPESAAADAVNLLPCPACGGDAACRPDSRIEGSVFRCMRCDAVTFVKSAGTKHAGWRDGAMAWNRWARKAMAQRKAGA